ncbi:MAG: WD40 repeat domain-containing protein [Chitinophagaceae bacterium]
MKTILMMLILLGTCFRTFSQVKECERMYKEAIDFANKGVYELALNKLTAAKICNPQEKKFDSLIVKIYEEINQQKENAVTARREAESALLREKIAKQLEAEAKNEAVKQKEIVQNQLTRNYWNNAFAARANNKNLEALHFIAEAVAVSKDKDLTKNLLIDVDQYLPVAKLRYSLFHGESLNSAVISPDGKKILTTGKKDHLARLWDAETGNKIGNDIVHPQLTYHMLSAVFSPDGKLILTSGTDTAARLWNVATGKEILAISYPKDSADGRIYNIIERAIFSPDGERILTIADHTVCLWNTRNGKQIGSPMTHLNDHNFTLMAFFSLGGKQFLTTGDTTARLWKTDTGEQIGADMNHPGNGRINTAVFSPDDTHILIASDYKDASLWEAATTRLVKTSMTHYAGASTAFYSIDGKHIVTAGDSTAKVWDGITGRSTGVVIKSSQYIYRAIFSPDGKKILTSGYNDVGLWDAATGKPLGPPMKNGDKLVSVEFCPGSKCFLAALENGTVGVWDIREISPGVPDVVYANARTAVLNEDGENIITVSPKNIVRMLDINSGKLVGTKMLREDSLSFSTVSDNRKKYLTVDADSNHTARVWAIKTGRQTGRDIPFKSIIGIPVLSNDGKMVLMIASSDTGNLSSVASRRANFGYHTKLWNVETGKLMNFPKLAVKTAIFSSNGNYILTTYDKTVRLYNVNNGKQVGPDMIYGTTPISYANYAMFSPDGKYILAVSEDKSARVWKTGTGKPVGITMQHMGAIRTACFSNTGKYILTASEDNTARVWEAATGNPVGPAMVYEETATNALFSRDDKRILTAYDDGSVRLWETGTGKLIDEPISRDEMMDNAFFSGDGAKIIKVSNDTLRIWTIAGDLDIPNELFLLQVRALTGCKLRTQTNELEIIPANNWTKLNDEYYNKAKEHYQVCKYAKYNLWAQFYK